MTNSTTFLIKTPTKNETDSRSRISNFSNGFILETCWRLIGYTEHRKKHPQLYIWFLWHCCFADQIYLCQRIYRTCTHKHTEFLASLNLTESVISNYQKTMKITVRIIYSVRVTGLFFKWDSHISAFKTRLVCLGICPCSQMAAF